MKLQAICLNIPLTDQKMVVLILSQWAIMVILEVVLFLSRTVNFTSLASSQMEALLSGTQLISTPELVATIAIGSMQTLPQTPESQPLTVELMMIAQVMVEVVMLAVKEIAETQTSIALAIVLETLTEITAMSTLLIQAGADNTTLKISTPEICAAHAMAVIEKKMMIPVMMELEVMRVKVIKLKKKKARATTQVATKAPVNVLTLTTTMMETRLEIPQTTAVLSTLPIQAGAADTTPIISTLEICVAHAMAALQVKLMKL